MKVSSKIQILCPIDFDVNSLAALDLARSLVKQNEGVLHVLHVLPIHEPLNFSGPVLIERVHHFAQIRLDEISRQALSDVDHRVILRSGRPAERIIAVAKEIGAYMIVMATHGRSGASRFFLGSVAESVIRGSSCPVLTIREAVKFESRRDKSEAAAGGF